LGFVAWLCRAPENLRAGLEQFMSTTIIGLIDGGKVVIGTPSPPFGKSRLYFRDEILHGVASTTEAGQHVLEAFSPPKWPPHFSFGSYIKMVWGPALERFTASVLDDPCTMHVILGFGEHLLFVICERRSVLVYRPSVTGAATALSPHVQLAYASLEKTIGEDAFDRITAAAIAVEGPLDSGMTILST
jgi:hypothetical protein